MKGKGASKVTVNVACVRSNLHSCVICLFWSLDVQNLVYMTQNENKEADSLAKFSKNVISFTDLFKMIFHN